MTKKLLINKSPLPVCFLHGAEGDSNTLEVQYEWSSSCTDDADSQRESADNKRGKKSVKKFSSFILNVLIF